jgi:prephenate dehydrogenase
VVILCVPVSETIRLVPVIASEMREGTVLTDVASVKQPVVAAMESTTAAGRCVGGHPVAGKETSGIASADPEIFRAAPYAIVPGSRTEPASVETLRRLVGDIGGLPVEMDADAHDAMVARTSHLPQVLSSAFSLYLEEGGRADLKGSGARGMLRLAASDEKLWSEILTYNRDNVSAAILEFVDVLQGLDDSISSGHSTAIEADMRRAREAVS